MGNGINNNRLSEVTNIIEPVLLVKSHIGNIGKSSLSDLAPIIKLVCAEWGLRANRVRDFRVAVKIIEESVIKN